jgi:hypothetical protein
MQHVAPRPELLGVDGERTDTAHRRERPGTWEPALGQLGLRCHARHGPIIIRSRLHHDGGSIG